MLAEGQGSGSETNVIGGMRSEAIIESSSVLDTPADIATKERELWPIGR